MNKFVIIYTFTCPSCGSGNCGKTVLQANDAHEASATFAKTTLLCGRCDALEATATVKTLVSIATDADA